MYLEYIVVLSFLSLLFYLFLDKLKGAPNQLYAASFIVAILSLINLGHIILPLIRLIHYETYNEIFAFANRAYGMAFLPWTLVLVLCLLLPLFNFKRSIRRNRSYQLSLLLLFFTLIVFYSIFGFYSFFNSGWSTEIYNMMNIVNIGLGFVFVLLLNSIMTRIVFAK